MYLDHPLKINQILLLPFLSNYRGTIFALGNNDIGVTGILSNPTDGFTLHVAKGLNDNGEGTISGIIQAFEGCIDAGANIINMSLGGTGGGVDSFNDVLREAYLDYNVLVVAAAGNNGDDSVFFPASYESVMSVAAVKDKDKEFPYYTIAKFSNYNQYIEIAAPGYDILSTTPGEAYEYFSGTSMASPHIAGAAALLWSHNNTCSAQQYRRILLASASDYGFPGCDESFGHGMVQARAAVEMLQSRGCEVADELDLLDTDGMNDGSFCNSLPYEDWCTSGTDTVTIDLLTDEYPEETSWEILDREGIKVAGKNDFGDEATLYQHSIALCKGRQYDFVINDRYGDGICCEYGNGAYSVWLGNEPIVENGGEFEYYEASTFWVDSPFPPPTGAPPTVPPPTLSPGIFINAGSLQDYIDGDGNVWEADAPYTSGSRYSTPANISNTDDPILFQTERWKHSLEYEIPCPNGSKEIHLFFAEIFDGAFGIGKRIMDIFIEDEQVANDFDIFQAAGNGNAAYIMKKSGVLVTDGVLNIKFVRVVQNAKVSAIAIYPSASEGIESTMTNKILPTTISATTDVLVTTIPAESDTVTSETITTSIFEPDTTTPQPSSLPSSIPSNDPSAMPSSSLSSNQPSVQPSSTPFDLSSPIPSMVPSDVPSIKPSSMPSNSGIRVTKLVLVNAATNADVSEGGFECSPYTCMGDGQVFNIRADTTEDVRSVRLSLNGPVTTAPRVEDASPFSLFGDISGDYFGRKLPPGSYQVIAEPFGSLNALGQAGSVITVNFVVADPAETTTASEAPEATTMTATSTMPIITTTSMTESFQTTTESQPETTRHYTLHPSTSPSRLPSFTPFSVPSDTPSFSPTNIIETLKPSTLPSGIPSNSPSSPPSNVRSLSPTGMPSMFAPTPTLRPNPSFGISKLILVNAITNEDIPDALDCTPKICVPQNATLFNIRAEIFESLETIASVQLTLDGPTRSSQRVENVAPYALFGDVNGNYFGSTLSSGDYFVTARAFLQEKGQGQASDVYTLRFTV
jgi:hypothetical protein